MTNTLFRNTPIRPTENVRASRGDGGAAAIVILMMSLVFIPVVLAHLAMSLHGLLPAFGHGHLASLLNLVVPAGTSAN